MNTYTYRDLRLARVDQALAALAAAQAAPDPALEQERAVLLSADWRVFDRTYLLIGTAFLSGPVIALKSFVAADPVLAALGEETPLTDAQAQAVEALPRLPGAPRPGFLEEVRAALDGDEALLAALLHTAHRLWAAPAAWQPDYPYDDAGILLPLRLETLFDPPPAGETQWTLSLRVVPDEASVLRDNPRVGQGEADALSRFWSYQYVEADGTPRRAETAAPPAAWLEQDGGKVAWEQLCAQVSPRRAAWLLNEFPPTVQGDAFQVSVPPERMGGPLPNRVGGMPELLEVWAVLADGRQLALGTLRPKPKRLDLPLYKTLAEAKDHWLVSWPRAVRASDEDLDEDGVGLGGTFRLPEGANPESLRALFVFGLGEDAPAAHFQALAAAGEIGLMPLGTPTNTVHGAAAVDLAKDPATWRKVAGERLKRQLGQPGLSAPAASRISLALLGDAAALPFFPSADIFDDTQESPRLMQALWPALWGHFLLDVWRLGGEVHQAALWAAENLYPEGPLMPLRIADQPYGLLPVSSLAQWQVEPSPNPALQARRALEQKMAGTLATLLGEWAAAGRRVGTVVQQPLARFMDLVGRGALSQDYMTRSYQATRYYTSLPDFNPDQADDFQERARSAFRSAAAFLGRPDIPDAYLAAGPVRPLHLPLVQPTRLGYVQPFHNPALGPMQLRQVLERLLTGARLEDIFNRELGFHLLPASLLMRLLVYATQVAFSWKENGQLDANGLRVFDRQNKFALDLADELDSYTKGGRARLRHSPIFVMNIPEARKARLERALRATLDAAAHRIDPWVTGFAWQRLLQTSRSPARSFRLGAYGWLEGPFIGAPGPNQAGLIHAPSQPQAMAGLMLRDKFLSAQGQPPAENGRNPWEMNIVSHKVRAALEMAEEVRLGFNILEILGRKVENLVNTFQGVRFLRTTDPYAMRAERKDPNEVCNGDAALRDLLARKLDFLLSADAAQQSAQLDELQTLQDARDTYADLMIADGALHLVNRQTERAAEIMDAAAGFSRPPEFEFVRTPPSGYQLETRALLALPFVPLAALGPDARPIQLADPSMAAFLLDRLGQDWTWTALDDAGVVLASVTLAGLNLSALDALALSDELLHDAARLRLALPAARIQAPRAYRLARQMAAALGSQPADRRSLLDRLDPAAAPTLDGEIHAELAGRYAALAAACQAAMDQLAAAADADGQVLALRAALSWGVAPVADPRDKAALLNALFGMDPPEPADLARLVESAGKALQARLAAAPAPDALPGGISELARAIAGLAAADGKIAVLAAWPRETLVSATGLKLDLPDPELDAAWLSVIAPVRPPLARFEALQLEARELGAFEPFQAWTSSPGQPWQEELVRLNAQQRATGSPVNLSLPRFTAAYGRPETWAGGLVAVSLLDSFSEAIPMPQRSTTAAFGFNAPAARAPQAILLAVPPRPRARLDGPTLLAILRETRDLVHARAARVENLGELMSLAPSMWLQAAGPDQAHLEEWPIFR